MLKNIVNVDGSAIANRYQVGMLTAKYLTAMDLNEEQLNQLFHPFNSLHENNAVCVSEACERILQAQRNHEKVFVAGDYDADGIMSTCIMKYVLDTLKIVNGYYIPDRFKEGYGLSAGTVEKVHAKGYSLIITVDNGVKAHEALLKARELGIDVIVTDHHRIDEIVEAGIVVHPDYMDPVFRGMCGAGVALQLANRLIGINPYLVALAGVATIGDVMELWNENRTLVRFGLAYLNQGVVPSINALIKTKGKINEVDISFQVVPKINAVARLNDMSNPNNLVPYFLCTHPVTIEKIAKQIDSVNNERKRLSSEMTSKASKIVNDDKFQLLCDPDFHEGMVGLVAGKLANELHKPVLVFSCDEGVLKGSGRSIPGIDLFEFFNDFDGLLTFGGHSQAVGLSLKEEDFPAFKEKVLRKISPMSLEDLPVLDQVILLDGTEISVEDVEEMELFHPFGQGLRKPCWALLHPKVLDYRKLKDRYPKYVFDVGGTQLEAISFINSDIVDVKAVYGEFEINDFRGKSVNLKIVSIE